jgi:hypothetical protein
MASNVICFRKESIEFTDRLNDTERRLTVPATVMLTCDSDDIKKARFSADDHFRVTVFVPVDPGNAKEPDQRFEFHGFAEPRQIIFDDVNESLTLTRTIYSGSDPLKARTAEFFIDFREGFEGNTEAAAYDVLTVYQMSVQEARRRST